MEPSACIAWSIALLSLAFSAQAGLLWEIGTSDDSAAEFALAPNGFSQYDEDAFYVIGHGDAKRDWPYVHPGPADGWAGACSHTFAIVFAIDEAPGSGTCTLRFDLIDTHWGSPPRLTVRVNGHEHKTTLPQGADGDASISGDFSAGKEYRFTVAFRAEELESGENEITITNHHGSWFIYDWVGLETPKGVRLAQAKLPPARIGKPTCPPVLVRDGEGLAQVIRIPVRHFRGPTEATVRVQGARPQAVMLKTGPQTVDVRVPAVNETKTAAVTFETDGQVLAESEVTLDPVRKWEIYLLHHTHLDIGYTHVQTEVEAIQWRHLEQAMELAEATRDYPPEARFKWLPEGLWAVDSYLEQASPEKRDAFVQAVHNGDIALDALYGNQLTALCRPEELLELTGCARRLAKQLDIAIDSAMISDVPGYTWGIVPVLAHSGVKYFSIGPNAGHRIGYTISEWGDKPFYWVSPSGKHEVLCWVAGRAYSWFHGAPLNDDQRLLDYLADLDAKGFPYDIVHVRYNIGGDNGPPDPNLPGFVKGWNERYAYPRLILGTPTQMFRAFEQRYGDDVPRVSGDFTPYWEDGAASSALETIINRAAAERIVQAQALWSILDRPGYSPDDVAAVWREAILYDEHTWGAHNSISQPECEFALGQWKIKQAFALEAERRSRNLMHHVLADVGAGGPVAAVHVFNTQTWPRTDVVVLPADWELAGELVKDAAGATVPSQRLSSGELAFLAEDVPATGAAHFTLEAGQASASGDARAEGNAIANGALTLTIDPQTGAITSLKTANGAELVNSSAGLGLNDYYYVAGRDPKDPQRAGDASIRVKEAGPLVASIEIVSKAPGCRALTREVRLYAGIERVDVIATLDKEKVYAQEAVHIAFPFAVPGGVTRLDLPFAVAQVEADQLAGACKNYFTVQRWADVSNEEHGVTWATIDAPLIEVGRITCDPRVVGWLRETPHPQTTLYSYVMNNYWETNYKAAQEGPTVFRYALRPHGPYVQAEAQRFGIERSQPLVAVAVAASTPARASLVRVEPAGVCATCIKPGDDGEGLVLRLYNGGGAPEHVSLDWGARKPKQVWLSNVNEERLAPAPERITMAPYEIVTLRAAL
ncbi:MAG TPA: hypothetical protein ENN80_07995 [Candidatus Hydrogenedentes bacterium]|nr:hypothetical protein [Candidatus Hydrogenedentota bacterium]